MKWGKRCPRPLEIPLEDIAERIGGHVLGDGRQPITGFSTLQSSGPGDISFYNNPRYRRLLKETRASAVVVAQERAEETTISRIVVEGDPRGSTLILLDLFYPVEDEEIGGLHPSAVVDGEAEVSSDAYVGPSAVVGRGCSIASGAYIGGNCSLGEDVCIGEGAVVHPNVTICDRCVVGDRTIVHAGVVVGADGFGFVRVDGTPRKLPQVGRVVIGCDAEIGALSAIDRGALGDTIIGDRVKIDNHVQIGHNVRIGDDSIICGKVGISGSVNIGRRVTICGHCGINGHITIADDVLVSGGSSVTRSIHESGKEYAGVIPAMPSQEWWRKVAKFVGRKGDAGRTNRENET